MLVPCVAAGVRRLWNGILCVVDKERNKDSMAVILVACRYLGLAGKN